jgi:hypothetical protein
MSDAPPVDDTDYVPLPASADRWKTLSFGREEIPPDDAPTVVPSWGSRVTPIRVHGISFAGRSAPPADLRILKVSLRDAAEGCSVIWTGDEAPEYFDRGEPGCNAAFSALLEDGDHDIPMGGRMEVTVRSRVGGTVNVLCIATKPPGIREDGAPSSPSPS